MTVHMAILPCAACSALPNCASQVDVPPDLFNDEQFAKLSKVAPRGCCRRLVI